jgi:hypothetical protein
MFEATLPMKFALVLIPLNLTVPVWLCILFGDVLAENDAICFVALLVLFFKL